ncbi:hypothetical protein Slin14017_G113200 [Septoria linicola]|nr:hypothetical protein Slin14017_G113200 [Septoria linicola]
MFFTLSSPTSTLDLYATYRVQDANLRLLKRLRTDTALQSRIFAIEILEWHLDPVLPTPKLTGQKLRSGGEMIDDPYERAADPWQEDGYFSSTYHDLSPCLEASIDFVTGLSSALQAVKPRVFRRRTLSALPGPLAEALMHLEDCAVDILRNPRAISTTMWSYFPLLNIPQINNHIRLQKALRSLEVVTPPGDEPLLSALGRLVFKCRHLECLRVYSLGRIWSRPNTAINVRSLDRARFRLTRSMSFSSSAAHESGRKLKLKILELDNFCVCGQSCNGALTDFIDVSSVEELSVSCFSLLSGAGDDFQPKKFRLSCSPPGIRDQGVFCGQGWGEHLVQQFLLSFTRLTHLAVENDPGILSEGLLQDLGPSLLSLRSNSTALETEIWRKFHDPANLTAYPLCANTFERWSIDEDDCKYFLNEAQDGCEKTGGTVRDACLNWQFQPEINPGELKCSGRLDGSTGVDRNEAFDAIKDFCCKFSGSVSTPEISNKQTFKQTLGNSEMVLAVDYGDGSDCAKTGNDAQYPNDNNACQRYLRRTMDDCDTNFSGQLGKFGGNITDGCGMFSLTPQVNERTGCGGRDDFRPMKRDDALKTINAYCDRDMYLDPAFNPSNNFYQEPPDGASWDLYMEGLDGYVTKTDAQFGDGGQQSGCLPEKSFSTIGDECKRKLTAGLMCVRRKAGFSSMIRRMAV